MAHVIWDTATDQPWTVDAHVTACQTYWDPCEDVTLHEWDLHNPGGDAVSVEATTELFTQGSYSLKCSFDPNLSASSYAKFAAQGHASYDWSLVDTLWLDVCNGSPWFVGFTLSCVSGSGGSIDTLGTPSLFLYPETWYTSLAYPLDSIARRDSITELMITLDDYSYPGALYLDALKLSEDLAGQAVGGKDSLVVESFESYDDTNDLHQEWYEKPSGGAVIDTLELATSSPAAGAKYMEVTFDLNVSPWWGGVENTLDSPVDASGFDRIDVAVKGTEGVYLTFQIADNAGLYANYDYLICHPGWTYYHCPLDSFVGQRGC